MTGSAVAVSGSWPTGTMRTLQFASPGELEIADVEIPPPAPGQILARVSHVGICGTDVHLLSGHSAYVQEGLTSYPIRFGHEWAGEVVAVADDVDQALLGATVVGEPFLSCGQCHTCRAGHYNLCPNRNEIGVRGAIPGAASEYFRVPATNVAVLPEAVPPAEGLLAEPSITVLHGLELAELQPGQRIAVLGTGTIGLIAVQLAASLGCEVDVIGIDDEGLEAALVAGAHATFHPDEALSDRYDVVFEGTGSPAIGPLLARIAAIGGRIVQIGIAPRAVDGIDLALFVSKGLSLAGVLGGVHLLPRAVRLIAAGQLHSELLIESIVSVADAEAAFARCNAPGRARPKIIFDMSTITDAVLVKDVLVKERTTP
ncbi:alcohol dehydrogenase catalytic domain-containing protein [soil metagenome]